MTDSPSVNLFELFAGNKDLEEEGRWIDLDDQTAIKIRAFGCQAVIDLRDKEMKPYQALLRAGAEIPKDKNEDIGLKVIAGAIIADWKGIRNAEGKIVPYSADEAYHILKALPKFAGFVINYSTEAQNFKEELREDSAGNSSAP